MRKGIKALVALGLVALLVVSMGTNTPTLSIAYAQESGVIDVSWEPPTEYEDGYPLLEQELDYYTFYCNDEEVKQIDSVIGTRSDMVDISNLPSGNYTCHLTVTSLEGMESQPSNTADFFIGARTPGSPALLTIS